MMRPNNYCRWWCFYFTVKLTKPWKAWNISRMFIVLQYDQSCKRLGHGSEPASVACGSGFSTLDWIFSCNAISFQNYYWCARFCSNYCTVQVFIIIIEPCIVQYDIYFLLFILQGGTVMIHMIHPTLLKTQCVVQRVHSTSPHHMIKSGSDLNQTAVIKTVVLLLVTSFTRTQVGPALQLIIIIYRFSQG